MGWANGYFTFLIQTPDLINIAQTSRKVHMCMHTPSSRRKEAKLLMVSFFNLVTETEVHGPTGNSLYSRIARHQLQPSYGNY